MRERGGVRERCVWMHERKGEIEGGEKQREKSRFEKKKKCSFFQIFFAVRMINFFSFFLTFGFGVM